jgi:hypothetical protein
MAQAPRITEELIDTAERAHRSAIQSGHVPTIRLTEELKDRLIDYDDDIGLALTILRRTRTAPSAQRQGEHIAERRSWARGTRAS